MRLPDFLSFSGRAKRAKFLQFLPLAVGFWLLAAWLDERFLAPNLCRLNPDWICYLPGEVREGITLDRAAAVLLLWPLFSVLVRRLHDHGRSGWWSLLVVPLLYLLYAFLYRPELPLPLWLLVGAIVPFLPLAWWIARKADK